MSVHPPHLSHRAHRVHPIRRRLVGLGAVGALVAGPVVLAAGPASAALAAVSTANDPATGYPIYYEDSAGTRLTLCVDQAEPCLLGATAPNPGPAAVPGNFPDEAFYFIADADFPNNPGVGVRYVLEAAFGNATGTPEAGAQIVFGRINIRVASGLTPGATYTVTGPYGVHTITAEADGSIKPSKTPGARVQDGCGATPPACDFSLALATPVNPFLRWDPVTAPAAPAGFLGDAVTPHAVTGSPTGTNFVQIDGPNIGGAGVNTIRTTEFVVAGKIAPGATRPDLVATSDSGLSNSDDVTNATLPTFTGSAAPSATLVLRIDGVANGGGTSDAAGSYTVTPTSALTDGTHQVTVTVLTGTVESIPSPALPVTIDTIAPGAPSVTGTNPAGPSNSTTPSAIGTADPGTSVAVYTNSTCTPPASATGTAAAFGTSGLPVTVPADTDTSLTATATDLAGNPSGCSTTQLVYRNDSTAPAAPAITSGPTGVVADRTAQFTVASTDPDPATTLQCRLDAGAWTDCTAGSSGYSGLTDGAHTFGVRASDPAGNSSGATTRSWTVDTTGPVISITAPVGAVASASPAVTWTSSETATFTCSVDAAPAVACSSGDLLGPLTEGAHTVVVAGTDPLGNSASASRQFTVDTIAPVVTITGKPTNPTTNHVPSFTFTNDGGTPLCSFVVASAADGFVPCTTPTSASYPTQRDGSYRFSVMSTDPAGNVGRASYSFTITTAVTGDTTPPSAPGVPTMAISGGKTVTPAGEVPVLVRWAAATDASGIASYAVEDSTDGGVSWRPLGSTTGLSLLAPLAPGSHRVRVTATDASVNHNVGPSRTSVSRLLTLTRDGAVGPRYAGVWTTPAVPGALDGTEHVSTARGATVSWTFTGKQVSWVATKAPNRGRAAVLIDGVQVATIDLFARATLPRTMAFTRGGLALTGSHTITIRVLGAKNLASTGTGIGVDGFASLR